MNNFIMTKFEMNHIKISLYTFIISMIVIVAISTETFAQAVPTIPACSPLSAVDSLETQKSRVEQFRSLREKRNDTTKIISSLNDRLTETEEAIRNNISQQPQLPSGYPPLFYPLPGTFDIDMIEDEKNVNITNLEIQRIQNNLDEKRKLLTSPNINEVTRTATEADIKKIEFELAQTQITSEAFKKNLNAKISRNSEHQKVQAEQQKTIQSYSDTIKKKEEDRAIAFNKQTSDRKYIIANIQQCRDSLGDVDYRASNLIELDRTEGRFKVYISMVFSTLVAFVIIGFFYIAQSDDRVKFAIFANDAGIQFITLFSIVIAVILFGIIGVLESKELSALLGGLSGYILGRGATLASKPQSVANEQNSPQGGEGNARPNLATPAG